DRDYIEIIGRLPDYVSGSGYRIAPVLGIVRPGFSLTLNSDEVDTVFEVPLGFLMEPANHTRDSRMWNDLEWFFYEMPYGGQRIWGVTAGIIRTLYERLYS
ncbi:MAG: CoA pyrophosphatase, partial [Mesorhizobium sp.]